MKYKTLIEKNSELVLTEGRLTPPPPPHTPPLCKHHSPPPVSRYRLYRLPTRQRCIYAGQEDRGELEKNACAENTIEACGTKYQNMWISEQLSCCCSCSFSCSMVSLELVVLLPSYIFLTEVVLTRRLHFFVQAIIAMPMTRKLSELSPMQRLKRIATFGSFILPKLTRKEKPRRWVTLKIEGFTEKAQTKLLVHCVQNSERKFQDASA